MEKVTFVILSFEGPDRYSHAGGLGSRVMEMSHTLAGMGFETHLFFIGDPDLPGHETAPPGNLFLHRWCQWISRYSPNGVYEDEEGKLRDWSHSLPGWLETELLAPKISDGERVVILAEEWHTVESVLALRSIVENRGWGNRVHLLWNVNNTFSFYRIDWKALKQAAVITTVSRYMKNMLLTYGVDARVIPNGISEAWFEPVDPKESLHLYRLFRGRLTLAKVARWDPDKRWDMAIDAVAGMKHMGLEPLLLARGDTGRHKYEIFSRAQGVGLRVASACWEGPELYSFVEAVRSAVDADIVNLEGYLSTNQRRVLFRTADIVMANSGVEPFGLVGLEAMAVGGLAFVGCTGEDYVTPGHDAVSIQTNNPREIVSKAVWLRDSPESKDRLRRAARQTARHYSWQSVIERLALPFLWELGLPIAQEQAKPTAAPTCFRKSKHLSIDTFGRPLHVGGRDKHSIIRLADFLGSPSPQDRDPVGTGCST